jgi:acyl-CoA reductase-like NAD-dependent aldehyde dehydrogenase
MLTRVLSAWIAAGGKQNTHWAFKFPSILPKTTEAIRDMLKPFDMEVGTTDIVETRAGQERSCLLLMGSKKVEEVALGMASQKKYTRVIFSGPTGVQSVVVEKGLSHDKLDTVSEYAVHRAFMNSGQYCMGSKRLLVHTTDLPKVYQSVERALTLFPTGNPLDRGVLLSTKMAAVKRAHFEKQLEVLEALPGASRVHWKPKEAAVFTLPSSTRLPTSFDAFGPLLVIQPYANEKQLVDEALADAPHAMILTLFGSSSFAKKIAARGHDGIILKNPAKFDFSDPNWKVGGSHTSHFVKTVGAPPTSLFNLREALVM